MKYVKLFGIELSGSSFLASALRLSFKDIRVLIDEFGWVHGLPKHPKTWIKNECPDGARDEMSKIYDEKFIYFIVIIRNPYDWYHLAKKTYREWSIWRAYEKYLKLYRGYQEMLMGGHSFFARGILVRFEDLRDDPWEALEPAERLLEFERRRDDKPIKSPRIEANPGIPQDELDIINNILPDELFIYYGYNRIINSKDL